MFVPLGLRALRYFHSSDDSAHGDRASTATSVLPKLYCGSPAEEAAQVEALPTGNKSAISRRGSSKLASGIGTIGARPEPKTNEASENAETVTRDHDQDDISESVSRVSLSQQELTEVMSSLEKSLVTSLADILQSDTKSTTSSKDFVSFSKDSRSESMTEWSQVLKMQGQETPFRLKLSTRESSDNCGIGNKKDGLNLSMASMNSLTERYIGMSPVGNGNPSKILFIDPFARNKPDSPRRQMQPDVSQKKVQSNRETSFTKGRISFLRMRTKPKLNKAINKVDSSPPKVSFRLRPETEGNTPMQPENNHAKGSNGPASQQPVTASVSEREKSEIHSMKMIESCITARNITNASEVKFSGHVDNPPIKKSFTKVKPTKSMLHSKSKPKILPKKTDHAPQMCGAICKQLPIPYTGYYSDTSGSPSLLSVDSYTPRDSAYKNPRISKSEWFPHTREVSRWSPHEQKYQNDKPLNRHSQLYNEMLESNQAPKRKVSRSHSDANPRLFQMKIGRQNIIVVDHNRSTDRNHTGYQFPKNSRKMQQSYRRSPSPDPQDNNNWVPPNTPHYEEICQDFDDMLSSLDQSQLDGSVSHINKAMSLTGSTRSDDRNVLDLGLERKCPVNQNHSGLNKSHHPVAGGSVSSMLFSHEQPKDSMLCKKDGNDATEFSSREIHIHVPRVIHSPELTIQKP